MRRGLLILLAAVLVGCGGEAGALSEHAETFDAVVNATPDKVMPGQWVRFELQMKSSFSKAMVVNLTMRLVENFNDKVVYTKHWDSVTFDVGEVYNITDNYLSATDTVRTAHRVELEATSVETGEVVWKDDGITTIEFSY